MTIAINPRTNEVLGQVVDRTPQVSLDRDPRAIPMLLLLTRDGWKSVPADSVRVEEVR